MPPRKLTWATAQYVKELLAKKWSSPKVAEHINKLYNLDISVNCVDKIRQGRSYKTIKQSREPKLRVQDRNRIRYLRSQGIRPERIAVEFNVCVSTINRAIRLHFD